MREDLPQFGFIIAGHIALVYSDLYICASEHNGGRLEARTSSLGYGPPFHLAIKESEPGIEQTPALAGEAIHSRSAPLLDHEKGCELTSSSSGSIVVLNPQYYSTKYPESLASHSTVSEHVPARAESNLREGAPDGRQGDARIQSWG